MINGIRRSSNLQHMMEQAVVKRLIQEGTEREIFVRFEQLTQSNFEQVINSGCSMLMLNFNLQEGLNR